MNDIFDEGPGLRERLGALVPVVLIALVALGNVLFGLLTVWPAWQDNEHLRAVASGQELALTATAQAVEGAADVLQHQLDSAQGRLGETAGLFLTSAQADDMLDLLYRYAQDTDVEIARLQLDPAQDGAVSDAFKARAFQIEVEGEPRDLLDFIVHVKESGAPSVQLADVETLHENDHTSLHARLILHSSPYASGVALEGVAQPQIVTPVAPSPTPFRLPPTATPTATLTPTITPTATPTTATRATATPTIVAPPSPTPTTPPPTPTAAPEIMRPGSYNDDSPLLGYSRGQWILIASLQGTDASYRYSEEAGAAVGFRFEGTSARVQYVSFRNFGIFEVDVDGALWTVVDSYAPSGVFGREVVIDGLSYGVHTVTIRNTGRRNPASEGAVIALDAVHIPEAVAPSPTPALQTLGAG